MLLERIRQIDGENIRRMFPAGEASSSLTWLPQIKSLIAVVNNLAQGLILSSWLRWD